MRSRSVVTFGEIMLRLSTPGFQRFVQTSSFDAAFGGGEANVAVSLAQFGVETFYVTRLPDNELGDTALNSLRRFGVRTDFIHRGGERLGIYFLETGASQRGSKVIYDRAHSAMAELRPGMIDWQEVLRDRTWFHTTGITPALGPDVAQAAIEAVREARNAGLRVSCDLNFRKKLWTRAQAETTMAALMEHVDVAIANEEDAEMVFGIKAGESDVEAGRLDAEKYQSVAEQLMKRCPSLQCVALTLRESITASDNNWSAVLWDGKKFYRSRRYAVRIVDRVGGGDSFAAGLIYAMLHERPLQESLDFAVAASCLKQTIPGDFNHVSVREVESLLKGKGSGRVER